MSLPIPPGSPVPIVPATRSRLNRRAASTVMFAIGTILSAIVDSTEVLKETFSGVHWVPKALVCVGIAWLAWQRLTDTNKTTQVNFTPPAASPASPADEAKDSQDTNKP